MSETINNGYELSDFSVDIFDRGDNIQVYLDCFANDHKDVPFQVGHRQTIDIAYTSSKELFYAVLSATLTKMINDIANEKLLPPPKCKCQDREWFREHPDDRQEYWRTKAGRIYPKAHTIKCPNNPSNRRKQNG